MAGQILSAAHSTLTRFHADGDKFHIQTTADVEPVLEHAKALHNAGRCRAPNGDLHLARIPITVLNAWAIERGVTYDAVMSDCRLMDEFLNNPDHSLFRVHKGRA